VFGKRSRIILALDVVDERDAIEIVEATSSEVDAIKIGNPLVYSCGLDIVSKIKRITDLPVIGDFKFVDVPFMVVTNIQILMEKGIDGVMVWGFLGREITKRCVNLFGDGGMVFVVTGFTCSESQKYTDCYWREFAEIAKDAGACGVQAPGTKPSRISVIREIIGKDKIIISCGIGRQGAPPGTAVAAGADFEIIGRDITEALDPSAEVIKIKEKIKMARKGKLDNVDYCRVNRR
jgi:orotidine-5'-phosphate decarboxylase